MRRARRVLVVAMNSTQQQVLTLFRNQLQAMLPPGVSVVATGDTDHRVMPGTISLHVTFPGPPTKPPGVQYPVLDGVMPMPIERWNGGDRERATLSALFDAGLAEPYVDWFGNLGWRATDDGKKEGLK